MSKKSTFLLLIPILVFVSAIGFLFSTYGFSTVECDGTKWELVFEDNFDSFDRNSWQTMHDNGNRTLWSNKELQWYNDGNVYAENGILKLVAKKESIYGKDVESEKQFEFTSGMICDSKSLSQKYGKWEMKVKFPFRKGFWPAFYLVPLTRPTLPEIDVFEYFGKKENEISCTQHWGKDYGLKPPDYNVKSKELTGDFSDVWMIWAIEVTPKKMVWKLNNNIVFSSKKGLPKSPLYMIANLAIKDWQDAGISYEEISNNAEGNPYVMEIDYVKIYKMVQ